MTVGDVQPTPSFKRETNTYSSGWGSLLKGSQESIRRPPLHQKGGLGPPGAEMARVAKCALVY